MVDPSNILHYSVKILPSSSNFYLLLNTTIFLSCKLYASSELSLFTVRCIDFLVVIPAKTHYLKKRAKSIVSNFPSEPKPSQSSFCGCFDCNQPFSRFENSKDLQRAIWHFYFSRPLSNYLPS